MLSYLFGYGDRLVENSFACNINNNTLFKVEINYCNKKIKNIVFSNQTYNLYLTLYSHPTWDSASKKLKYKLRCNELFYPHRKTIKSFAELLNYYHLEICRDENEKLIFNIQGKQFTINSEDIFLKMQ